MCVVNWLREQSGLFKIRICCRNILLILTLSADAPEVGDLHKHAGEHVRFVGAATPGVDLQSLK